MGVGLKGFPSPKSRGTTNRSCADYGFTSGVVQGSMLVWGGEIPQPFTLQTLISVYIYTHTYTCTIWSHRISRSKAL